MEFFLAMNLRAEPALKDAFKNDFLIGAALNPAQFCESNDAGGGAGETAVQFHHAGKCFEVGTDSSRTRPV